MLAVALSATTVVDNVGSAISVLLVLPALVAAYTARGNEPTVTTKALFGLRLLTASVGLWPFVAGLVLAVGTSCTAQGSNQPSTCGLDSGVDPILWLLFVLSAATFLVMSVAFTLVWRPSEQRR
jgi:hypothetical protein